MRTSFWDTGSVACLHGLDLVFANAVHNDGAWTQPGILLTSDVRPVDSMLIGVSLREATFSFFFRMHCNLQLALQCSSFCTQCTDIHVLVHGP